MTGQDLLQVSYALFQELGRIILQMLCPFQPCWCPSQQLMEITGCRAASTAGQPQGFERIPAAYIQCKNVLLRPGPARGEPSPPSHLQLCLLQLWGALVGCVSHWLSRWAPGMCHLCPWAPARSRMSGRRTHLSVCSTTVPKAPREAVLPESFWECCQPG